MYEDLNEKQISILKYIISQTASNGYPPAVREICKGVGIKSTSTVHNNLNTLEKNGYIRRSPQKNRALEVIFENSFGEHYVQRKTVDIPIIGKVTAGEPILAQESIEDFYPIPVEMAERGTLFILKVRGESMIEAGILDGDKVVVRQQQSADNGDIIVALLDDSATVKRYYKMADHIELRPENATMSPIITTDIKILGKVIGLFREFY